MFPYDCCSVNKQQEDSNGEESGMWNEWESSVYGRVRNISLFDVELPDGRLGNIPVEDGKPPAGGVENILVIDGNPPGGMENNFVHDGKPSVGGVEKSLCIMRNLLFLELYRNKFMQFRQHLSVEWETSAHGWGIFCRWSGKLLCIYCKGRPSVGGVETSLC